MEAHNEITPHGARLTFSLSAQVPVQAYVLAGPARVIIDLPDVNFQIDPQEGEQGPQKPGRKNHGKTARQSADLIASYRFGALAPGKSRIVVDLNRPAKIVAAQCAPLDSSGVAQLTLELAADTEAEFKLAARDGSERQIKLGSPAPELPNAAPPAVQSKPVIVLDPGHGGVDVGAMGRQHAVEKAVVLDFAKTLATQLRASGQYKVVMTRDDDTFVPLGERVRIARRQGAALFVSIHADTLSGGGDNVQGATVYTVSDRASDAEAARVAESENKADAAAGVETKEEAGDVNDILFDLTRRETRAYSHVFAHSLTQYWKVAARLNKNPARSAGFVVLKAPDVPSVLLELGYLSNDQDAAQLTSPVWRDKAAEQVAHAIDAFFAPRLPSNAPKAASAPLAAQNAPKRAENANP